MSDFIPLFPEEQVEKMLACTLYWQKKKEKEKTNLSGHASIHLHQGSVHMI